MNRDLTDVAGRAPFDGDFAAEVARLGAELEQLQIAQRVHGRRSIIVFEGWEGGHKKDALRTLAHFLDPCYLRTECVHSSEVGDSVRHWLARFWGALPAAGHTLVFFHSWYRVLASRMLAGMDERMTLRAMDEINEFEAQQRDHDTIFVKLFFHTSAERQAERLRMRRQDAWHHALYGEGEVDSLRNRLVHEQAWTRILGETDMRWAPWSMVNSADARTAIVETLRALTDAYRAAIPADPPAATQTVVELRPAPRIRA